MWYLSWGQVNQMLAGHMLLRPCRVYAELLTTQESVNYSGFLRDIFARIGWVWTPGEMFDRLPGQLWTGSFDRKGCRGTRE